MGGWTSMTGLRLKVARISIVVLVCVALVCQFGKDERVFLVTPEGLGEDGHSEVVSVNEHLYSELKEKSSPPRILTILTTYGKRSSFIKPYKEAVRDRQDGYQPTVFAVSDEEDEESDEVVDYKIGTPRRHRLLPAIREACRRYGGSFDWLAIGDDDTVFMYNRAIAFLKNINHSQPVAFARVDGLNPTASPCVKRACFSPEQKMNKSDQAASQGCCLDFSRPCEVPIYPAKLEANKTYRYEDYGPGGLFWPYGGSGTFISAGLAMDVVGGANGWDACAQFFGIMNTDVQFAQCLKKHGYSMGRYPEGFVELETSDPEKIREVLSADCRVMGVHLGMNHLLDGGEYTIDSFRAAVSAVRDEDLAWSGHTDGIQDKCPDAWAAIYRWGS
ncbi:unnamed protein product [Ascophyllum nodosum]